MTTDTTAVWAPTKDEYTDEEIKATPVFARFKQDVQLPGPGGKTIQLSDEAVVALARPAIAEMWAAVQSSRFDDSISAVFVALDGAEIDHGNEVIIRRNPETGVCSFKPTKNLGKKRFSHEGYARLIGYCEPQDGKVYKEALDKLKAQGRSEKDLRGGFLLVKSAMKSAAKNGVSELVIEEGDPNNELAKSFKATLYQYPDNKAKLPAIVFPPRSGNKDKLIINDEIHEVSSMSQMMKKSVLNGAQTPAVLFNLVERLKALGVDENEVTEEGDEESEETADAPANTASQPAKKGNAASKLLADE